MWRGVDPRELHRRIIQQVNEQATTLREQEEKIAHLNDRLARNQAAFFIKLS